MIINGKEEDRFKEIAKNYISSWLIIDCLTMIPYDLLFNSSGYTMLAKLPRVIKFIRITRIVKFTSKMNQDENTTKFKSLIGMDKQTNDLLLFFILIIVLTHVSCCLFYLLVQFENGGSWIDNVIFQNDSPLDLYITSFYWAITTICTVGYGDVHSVTDIERVFNILWICIGVAFYSYTVGTLTNIISANNLKKS